MYLTVSVGYCEGTSMLSIEVFARATKEPLIRTPAVMQRDVDNELKAPVPTDRLGVARLDLRPGTGRAYPYPAVSSYRVRAVVWSDDRACNRYWHKFFPQDCPQEPADRPADWLRASGES